MLEEIKGPYKELIYYMLILSKEYRGFPTDQETELGVPWFLDWSCVYYAI